MSKVSAETIQQWYDDCKDETAEWRTEAKENYDLVAGWQWTKQEENELKAKKRQPVVMNRLAPYVDAVIGYQVNNRKEARYLPRENSDSMTAHILSEAGRWADDLCDAEDEVTDAFGDMLITGMGWTESRMDYATDPDGRLITRERVDPLEMFWDINATKRNLSDAGYVVRARKMERTAAEERWPILKKITPSFADDEEAGTMPLDGTNTDYDESGRGSRDGGKEKPYLILQCQWFRDETIYRVADPASGSLVSLTEKKFNIVKETLDQAGIKYVKSSKRRYYQTWSTGDTVLEEGDAPSQEGFTLKSMCAKRDRNHKTWYGMVRALRDPQKFSNKFFSDFLYILATNRKGGLFAETGAFVDPRKAEEQYADPSAILTLNAGGLTRIREREAAQIPAGIDRLLQYAINAVPEVSGMNPELVGMADRAQPGILEAQRKQAGLTILAPLFDALKRHTRETGRIVLDMIRKYINDGRLIRIVGQDGQQAKVPLIVPDAGTYDIIVDESPTTPNQKEQTLRIMTELLPLLAKGGIPLPPDLVEYLPLPATLIEKWKQMMSPKEQKPDPKVQLEMMKLQFDQKEAELKAQTDMMQVQENREQNAIEIGMQREKMQLEIQSMQMQAAIKQAELQLKAAEIQAEKETAMIEAQAQRQKVEMESQLAILEHKHRMEEIGRQSDADKHKRAA